MAEAWDSVKKELPYLFEYNTHNLALNFNQKLRLRVIHELQQLLLLSLVRAKKTKKNYTNFHLKI